MQHNGELELTLVSLEAKNGGKTFPTRAGHWWGGRGLFIVRENGKTNQDWEVHSLALRDAGGNARRATGPRDWNGNEFEIFFDPLFLTEGAWQLDASVVRRRNFSPAETATFTNVPMPSADGPADAQFRTNLLGRELILHVMKVARVDKATASGAQHSMGSPGFAVELATRDADLVPRISMIVDNDGNPMKVPPHGYGQGYSVMRFRNPTDRTLPTNLTVQVTIQPQRIFTFLAEPKVIE
jgi:hypothetical protein